MKSGYFSRTSIDFGKFRWAAMIVALLCGSPAPAGDRVPLGDEVHQALIPAGISNADAELSGSLLYLWDEPDATAHVIHFNGHFDFRLGTRRLQAREAIVWMTIQKFEERSYAYFEVFLWHDARIIDPGGAETTGPALFATAATFGKVRLSADKKAHEDNSASPVYRDASAIRAAVSPLVRGEPLVETAPSPISVLEFAPPTAPAPLRTFSSDGIPADIVDGETILTTITNLYFAQGAIDDPRYLEIRSDAAVFFRQVSNQDNDDDQRESRGPMDLAGMNGIYLEGDVLLTQGERVVRADRVYYDLQHNRALILDPVMRIMIAGRNLPLYVRADEARQLSSAEYSATGARISTSEFHTPHYHIGAERIYFAVETAPSDIEGLSGARAGEYNMTHTTLNLNGFPLFYWPWAAGDFQQGEMALRGIRISNSGDFGPALETNWNFFSLLGMSRPEQFKEAILDLDYYADRGPGVGLRTKYESENSYGLFRSYYIYDDADEDNLGRFRDQRIDNPNRGRATLRHRFFLPDSWELTVEASYISDANFLEEYFEREFDISKDQETYLRLKKQRDNWALTILAQARILNWLTQTESLPEVALRLIGEPVGPFTLYSESRAGIVRYRPDERRFFISNENNPGNDVRSGAVMRADTRQELGWPLSLGPVKLVPFVVGRGTLWDDSPHDGGLGRIYGSGGVRGSMYLSKVNEGVQSEFWGLNGLRHIVKIDAVGWLAGSDRSSADLYPFSDDVEGIDDFSGLTVGVRQRWQTRRGPPDRRRVVDWITLDVEAGYFSDNFARTNGYVSYTRPEESITSNHVRGNFIWRLSDATALLADANYNFDRGNLGIANVSLAVERTPRFSYFLGWRMIDETDSNLFGFGTNYRISDKHAVSLRSYIDIDRGSTEQLDLTYVRRFPRWFMSFTFELDNVEDNVSVSMALWPEGFPNVALGPKRYTGLATSTAIKLRGE